MKTLTLIIKQEWFDSIMSGEMTREFRDVKSNTIKSLLELDEEGNEKKDENGYSIPIKYDAIRFYCGYAKDRDSALVEVKKAHIGLYVNDKDEPIKMLSEGELVSEVVVYDLGKVLEKNIHKK